MKKKRYLPFGYQMIKGQYEVVPEESKLIQKIFHQYLAGISLQRLAMIAEETGLKFRENANGWNKNMIARILDDERYWNGEPFPPIISRELAIKVIHLRRSKAMPESPVRFLQKKTACPQCGNHLSRNSKDFPRIFWDCKKCGTRFGPLSYIDILKAVSHKFLNLCRNPGLAEETEGIDNKLPLKVTRLTHEINQTLNQRQVEPEKTLSLILACVAEKYQVCQMGRLDHRTENIQDQLKGHSEDREMDRQLFNQIIEKVILEPKGSVKLQLINEKII